jgi:hypothetical protein
MGMGHALSEEAKVSEKSTEDCWFIIDGMEMYSVHKNGENLDVYESCQRIDVLFKDADKDRVGVMCYMVKGPVIYRFKCLSDDMIYDVFNEKHFEPMMATFEPIVVIR